LLEGEVTGLGAFMPDDTVIVASGPLTSDALARSVQAVTGEEYLYFFDAAAPIVSAESVDMGRVFWASRYGRGSDYLNCPMDERQYRVFYDALVDAECAALKAFDQDGARVFEGCMPVETMAKRGYETLLFGPLKPKGLADPRDGRRPFAVAQLRREDAAGSMFNLVGFQTHLRFSEQKRVFSLIPALRDAEFLRYGVMHRNTYLRSPGLLDNKYRLKKRPNIRFCGQITGVEGYVESAASGLMCGVYTAAELMEKRVDALDRYTALGALGEHVSASVSADFQPMNINFGIIEPLGQRVRGKERKNTMISERALEKIKAYAEKYGVS
jgi:methylenetetrahydrofolate--tRNA-(uracil-5-)-methyltransferase